MIQAANDNIDPSTGATVRTPAEHRAAVAKAGTATRRVVAWPTLSRMRGKADLARALLGYRDTVLPPAALDLRAAQALPALALDEDMDPDASVVIRPTELELIAAALRQSFTTQRREGRTVPGSEIRSHDQKGRPTTRHEHRVTVVRLGGVRFDGLMRLRTYVDDTGRERRPSESGRVMRGARPEGRDVRHLLPANDNAPIADGARFVGGRCRPSGTVSPGANVEPAATDAPPLPADTRCVLDLALTDATAQEIGEALGYSGPKAGKSGARRVDQALIEFAELYLAKVGA